MKKKTILTCLLILMMFTLLIAGCGNESANVDEQENLEKVMVSDIRSEFWLPAYLAYELGYFEEEGLDVEFASYKDGPIAFQGMHAGDSQFCMLSIEPVLRAYDEGKESIVILSALHNKPYMFVAREGIESINDLKGKVIFAGMPGSAPYSFVTAILIEAGLDPQKDVTWANMEYGASLSALQQGQVDAIYLRSTAKSEIAEMGAKVLVDVSDPVEHERIYGSKKYESTIVTVTKNYANSNPETIQKFTNAVVKAIAWQSEHSDAEVAEKVAPLFPGSKFTPDSVKYLRSSLSPDGYISEEGYSVIHKFCLTEGLISEDIPYNDVIDMSFVKKANEKLNQ